MAKARRRFPLLVWFLSSVLLAVLVSTTVTRAQSCPQAFTEVNAAKTTLDAERAARAFQRAEQTLACSATDQITLGRAVALIFYRLAYPQADNPDEQSRLLNRALNYGRPWKVLAWSADFAMQARHYKKAAGLYQEALDDIRDEKLNKKAPPRAIIAAIHKKAQEASLLSPVYITRITRDGEPTGLSCTTFRGYEVRKIAVPVQFEYDSTIFTEKGKAAVKDMLVYLRKQGEPAIMLIGHTDPRGTRKFNQGLSLRRAKAVKSYLIGSGYGGRIRVVGRGEDEPFQPDDPSRYSQDERYQLDRRVELDRNGERATCSAATP